MRQLWNSMFDVREGEGWKLTWMGLYLVLVLFAYYILKPVSRAMFLHKFDIDELPYLYILIAAAGGVMAYFYTKLAVHSSLKTAVNAATGFLVTTLLLIWYLLPYQWDWLLYFFNAFVSLFSITLVSQGWLIASNIFTTQEAKRLYGILGVGAVVGAAFGGSFTALMVNVVGTRNLLLASAVCVLLAWASFEVLLRQQKTVLKEARGATEEESFSFRDVAQSVGRYRHLQVIIAIIALTYIVDVTIEFQFNAMAKAQYEGDQRALTAFLGSFYGIWLNLVTFVLQFFLTAFIVSRFGVGGALQIMPITIALASIATFVAPGVWSTGAARLAEASTRYSFNRTGMELLYLPLPIELRNRTKAFMDIFVDRFARGIGGMLLVVFSNWLNLSIQYLALIVIAYSAAWILLSIRAKNEYVATVRRKLQRGRLDLQSLRVNYNEASTIRLLEEASESGTPRQAVYALSLLAEAPRYPLANRLGALAGSSSAEVRGKVFDLARENRMPQFRDQALAEVRGARAGDDHAAIRPAVQYVLSVPGDDIELAQRLVTHPNRIVSRAAVEVLQDSPEAAQQTLTREWIEEAASSPDPHRRMLAAVAVRVHGDRDTTVLYKLLRDSDPHVAAAAAETAGVLQHRSYLDALLRMLTSARLRSYAINALSAYGVRIVGTLGDVLLDTTTPVAVRRQIPRVLRKIPSQRSVEVLFDALGEQDLTVRDAVLKALNTLRETAPKLMYGRESLSQYILGEARYYYEMSAAMSPFRENHETPAARLLYETLEERLQSTLSRLFRLLGLKYPPREIYAAYLAMKRGTKGDEYAAAIDFLDNVLDRETKRFVMPLLDDDTRLAQTGQDLFGVSVHDTRTALRSLLRTGDSWLVACAIATAAELREGDLRQEIEPLARKAGTDVGPVAESALAVLS